VNNYFHRIIASFLAFALIFTMIPFQSFAASTDSTLNSQQVDTNSIVTQKGRQEIVSDRTENSVLFDNWNGTLTKNIYFDPITNLGNISTNLTSTTKDIDGQNANVVESENTALDSNFYTTKKNGEYAAFQLQNNLVTYSLLTAKPKVCFSIVHGVNNFYLNAIAYDIMYHVIPVDIS
jgi:hypothetical protein